MSASVPCHISDASMVFPAASIGHLLLRFIYNDLLRRLAWVKVAISKISANRPEFMGLAGRMNKVTSQRLLRISGKKMALKPCSINISMPMSRPEMTMKLNHNRSARSENLAPAPVSMRCLKPFIVARSIM